MDIPYEKKFHFRDGTAIGSLDELKAKIEAISYQEFYHHVNAEKNDFSNWVRYVLRDERLADDLQRVTSIVETVEILNDFLHPRPITATRDDGQSRIEQSIFTAPMPAEADDAIVEQVPTISPAVPAEAGKDSLDFTIIEEKIGMPAESEQGDARIGGKVREELFGTLPAPQATPADAQPAAAQPAMMQPEDQTRLIVKDFMYGLVFGLVIGIILGKIISFG